MSRVTIVSTVTQAVEVELPLGFLIDEKTFAEHHSKDMEEALRSGVPAGQRLLHAKVSTVVIPAW